MVPRFTFMRKSDGKEDKQNENIKHREQKVFRFILESHFVKLKDS